MAKYLSRISVLFTRCCAPAWGVGTAHFGQCLPSPRGHFSVNSVAPFSLRSFSTAADVSKATDAQNEEPDKSAAPVQNTEMTVDDFKELITSDETRRRIHLVLLEYVSCRDTVGRVPSVLSVEDMEKLLGIRSPLQRAKYFNYLFKTEMATRALKRRKEQRRLERLAAKEEKLKKAAEDGSINHIQYGIENTIFLFIRDQSIHRFQNYRQAYAAMFGQTLVFDLDYEQEMSNRELINAADQLQEVFAANRLSPDPFNLVFCGLKGEQYKHHVYKAIPHLGKPSCLITVTENSYLDLYPKEKLVYLTPDARQPLRYSDDAIYIVGAMVDLGTQMPYSVARAKRQGISFARLPLDEYLQWGQSSSKTLALNHITRILLDMKATKDWNEAFKAIPSRKLKTAEQLKAEQQFRVAKEHKKERVLKKFNLNNKQ
ncbi:mitochondrial ribonuclease P protein 1 homolog [Dermacentor andersoni]|uniref:mitochondrial ribonuclease P protein 1 homolog n=1 Tax=Dermacentor andersoni TaxID=34620 RepID=UPI00215570D5|nr:mitochondrial ribonuclease P protein 1 homolog [Dermacentor andersoni]